MQTVVERGCGLDVHQATVVACLLVLRKDGRVHKQVRTFGTTTRELVSLREWLLAEGCTHAAMESTGVYWKPELRGCRAEQTAQTYGKSCSRQLRNVAEAVYLRVSGDMGS